METQTVSQRTALEFSEDAVALVLTASATLKSHEQTVIVNAAAPVTVTLPPVMEAKGRTFFISQKHATGDAVTVTDQNDGLNPITDLVIDIQKGYGLFYSTGLQWILLGSKIA